MPTSCVAYGCTNRYGQWPQVGFYRFPKDQIRLKIWLIAIRRKDYLPSKTARICSEHFDCDCFSFRDDLRILKKNAIPTIFNFNKKPLKSQKKKNVTKPFVIKLNPSADTDIVPKKLKYKRKSKVSRNAVQPETIPNIFPSGIFQDISAAHRIDLPFSIENENEAIQKEIISHTSDICNPNNSPTYKDNLLYLKTSFENRDMNASAPTQSDISCEKAINITMYVNKIYCCTSKSDHSTSKENNCCLIQSKISEKSPSYAVKEMQCECSEKVNILNNNEINQHTISHLADAILTDSEKADHQTISYIPFIKNESPDSTEISRHNISTDKVKVTMHSNSYVLSKMPFDCVTDSNRTSNLQQSINNNDYLNSEYSTSQAPSDDRNSLSDFENYSIEDFTINDMENTAKAKAFFLFARNHISNQKKDMLMLKKL